jgi:hypothetical protein
MKSNEKIFNDFLTEVTGISDIDSAVFSPEVDSALVKDMDIKKTIGNINLMQGNIISIPESEKIVKKFLKSKIRSK